MTHPKQGIVRKVIMSSGLSPPYTDLAVGTLSVLNLWVFSVCIRHAACWAMPWHCGPAWKFQALSKVRLSFLLGHVHWCWW